MSWDMSIGICPKCDRRHDHTFNYTHNTNPMMRAAGHSPEDFDGKTIAESKLMISAVISNLEADPVRFEAMNPSNGWGSYKSLLAYLRRIRCEMGKCADDETVSVSM